MTFYRALRLRLGDGFESCYANGLRNVKNANPAKQRPVFSPLLPVGCQELVLKVPKQGQFHAAIRATTKRCDSCGQGALGRRTLLWRNFCDTESLAKRYSETCHQGHKSLNEIQDSPTITSEQKLLQTRLICNGCLIPCALCLSMGVIWVTIT